VLLGSYENFPKNVHKVAIFNFKDPKKAIQQAILFGFHRLNQETFDLNNIMPYLKQNYKVSFEFGVAHDEDFTFLDQNELEQCLTGVTENELDSLDFFFVIRYHRVNDKGKQIPLRFDYHVLRFIFHENILELRIRHERGIQRVQLDELTDFITKQVNIELEKKQLSPLNMERL